MKRKLQVMKTILVAVGLCAGVTSAWGETYLPTVTGTLESGSFQANRSKIVSIAKGESLTYTFVNTSVGESVFNNWVVEARDATTNSCCALRGDAHPGGLHSGVNAGAGYWTWEASTSKLSGTYTGSKWSDIDGTVASWLSAYSGVTVTLTIAYSNDGTTLTMTHSATVNASTYTGTYTVTGFEGNSINVFLSNEYATQNITKVVHTNASSVVTNYERKAIDLSAFDSYGADGSGYNSGTGVATFVLSSNAWAKLDFSSYYSGIEGTIKELNVKLTENIASVSATSKRFTFGIFGNNKTTWGSGAPNIGNAVTAWGMTGNSNANTVIWGTTSSDKQSGVLSMGTDEDIFINMNVIGNTFSWKRGTSDAVVNDHAFIDATMSMPKYLAAFAWGDGNTATLSNVSMEIVYVEATYYTATFTNTTSGKTPTVTIYTDLERTSEISNGMLENGETYYFTATEEGYQNYNGDFTVSGSDPAVNFSMTAKTVYNYSAKAIDGSSATLQASIASGTCYADESTSFYIPACVLVDGTLHFTANEDYKKTETVSNADQVFSYAYTTNTVNNVAYFYEGESLNVYGTYGASSTGNLTKESKGSSRRPLANSYLYTPALAGGVYTVYMHVFGNNAKSETLAIYYCDADGSNPVSLSVATEATTAGDYSLVNTANLNIPDGKCLCFYKNSASNSNYVIDYIYLVRTGVSATLGTNGYTTFASSYPLDLTTANLPTGVKAYKAAVDGTVVRFTELNQTVPANTGILLEGTANATVTIPVVASGSAVSENAFLVNTTAATITSNESTYYFAMVKDSNPLKFGKVNGVIIPANKAYLEVPATNFTSTPAPSLTAIFDDGNTTGINAVKNAQFMENGEYYNLAGQRVAQPTKGLYIVNGRKVVVK